jgi:hypothetical protein
MNRAGSISFPTRIEGWRYILMLFAIVWKETEIYEKTSALCPLLVGGLALSRSKYTYPLYLLSTFHTNFSPSS